jgi:hypothetical protein
MKREPEGPLYFLMGNGQPACLSPPLTDPPVSVDQLNGPPVPVAQGTGARRGVHDIRESAEWARPARDRPRAPQPSGPRRVELAAIRPRHRQANHGMADDTALIVFDVGLPRPLFRRLNRGSTHHHVRGDGVLGTLNETPSKRGLPGAAHPGPPWAQRGPAKPGRLHERDRDRSPLPPVQRRSRESPRRTANQGRPRCRRG